MNPQFLIQNNSNIDNTFNKVQNLIDNRDYIEENDLEQDNLLPSNPEDWKDTIFSGEGEIRITKYKHTTFLWRNEINNEASITF